LKHFTTRTPYWHYSASKNIIYVTRPQYVAGGKIEKNKMGGAHGAYGGGERCAQGSGGET